MNIIENIFSPSYIKKILQEYSLAPKQRFGQNFLVNRDIAQRILMYSHINKSYIVLEIGPGFGALTFFLSEHASRVVAVEIDRGLAAYLLKKIDEIGIRNIEVINEDFLKLDRVWDAAPDKVISNFPYSIALKAILKILEEYPSVREIVGSVQNEIAERIVAKPGEKNYSYVSVYLQFLSVTTIMEKHISPNNFFPAPEVESSIIKMQRVKNNLPVEKSVFKRVVKASFANRRKSLVNNLMTLDIGMKKDELEDIIRTLARDVRIRAENLSVHEFSELAKKLRKCLMRQA